MKKYISFLANLFMIYSLFSCNQTYQNNNKTLDNTPIVMEEQSRQQLEEENRKQQELEKKDSTAIANIHLNTTKEVFEAEKKQFLTENKTLGCYTIKSVTGFFCNDRLAAIEIISMQQTVHKDKGFNTDSWGMLYYTKYNKISKLDDNKFDYVYRNKGIIATDLCASDKPFSSFEELMENRLKRCYQNESTFPAHRMENNTDGIFRVSQVLMALPDNRRKHYDNIISDAAARRNPNDMFSTMTPTYQIVYDEARIEANKIIEQRNATNSKKHQNDPSWSVIIIAYMPAVQAYRIEQRNKQQEKQDAIQKELDKI